MNKQQSKLSVLRQRLLTAGVAFALPALMFAQNAVVQGTVKGEDGTPLIGAAVRVQGVKGGVVSTDDNGHFRIEAPAGSKLTVSYIGYEASTLETKGSGTLDFTLKELANDLGEAVVIGYGVQKKSVVTASIAKLSAADLETTAPVRVDAALKGLAAGVNVTSASGQPGAEARVNIRGIGTINNADPLYIVDGMPIEGGLDYLNPSDIESIEVLKDAASGAVYGARAANGVIIVTTKSGKKGKVSVNYNFSQGWQTKWRTRDVLNATEYAVLMNEGSVNAGRAPIYADPYSYGKGTNWQDLIFNDNAPVQNHEVNISGASDRVNYYLSMGYYTQDGIIGGNLDRSNYRRMSMRSNTKYLLFDDTAERDWLNKLEITSNLSFTRTRSVGIDANGWSNTVLGSTLTLTPMLTPTLSGADAEAALPGYYGYENYVPFYDKNGNLYTIPGSDYDTQFNPVAYLHLPGTWGWNKKFVANFAADLNIGYGFKYRFSYGADLGFNGIDKGYGIPYYLNSSMVSTNTSANAQSNRSTVWQLENVLTWDKEFGQHAINVVLGQSAKKSTGWYLGGSHNYLVDINKPYISYTYDSDKASDLSVWGGPNDEATLASLFARASYNYAERYMVQATIRRDGSSRFGPNHHYATFPSFSLGWNLTNEPFMEKRPDWLTNTKVRFSWGKNGNENIDNFRYAVYTAQGYNYVFGTGEGNLQNGTKANGLANPDLKWEESVQTDLGIDFGFLGNALTFTVDYFSKTTEGMLLQMPIPAYVGEARPWGNTGKMRNSGLEFEAGYKFHVGPVNMHVKGNLSYLHNELINLGNDTGFRNYDSRMDLGTITRAENGQPFPFFYGYKTNGIFQNTAEVNAYVNSAGELIQPNAVPGDFRFVDVNGDGKIDENDKTKIGKGMPDWTYGLNFGAEWNGFDFSLMLQGTIGNDIYDATMRVDRPGLNLPSWMLNRWTGEGSSNSVPRFVYGNATNLASSDLYVHDGSYLRVKNIQLGYTLPESLTQRFFVKSLRIYVAGENVLTFTKYHGFDPEVANATGGTSLGVDYGVYPQARVWTIGLNLGF